MSKSSSLNIREFINQHALSRNQWVLIALCFCIVAVDGMDVAIMGFVAPSIIAEWGISRPAFGAVMGAAPIGLAIGALVAGSSSDWWGRRKVLLGSVLFFGLCTLCTAHASNVTEMALWRLLTGLGLGAAMPNATTLLSEYVPEHRRSFLVAAMFTGFNLGSGVVGFIAAGLIPHWGWQSVLYVGGALPLLMLPLLYLYLPESARFMVTRGMSADRIAKVLGRVTQVPMADIQRFESGEPAVAARQPIAVLFSQGFKLRTLTLWSTYFMGLLVSYLTTSWLPTMMKDAGMSVAGGLADGPLQRQSGDCRFLPAGRGGAGLHGQDWLAVGIVGGAGDLCGLLPQRCADWPQRLCSRLLSHTGASYGCQLDAGRGPPGLHRGLVDWWCAAQPGLGL